MGGRSALGLSLYLAASSASGSLGSSVPTTAVSVTSSSTASRPGALSRLSVFTTAFPRQRPGTRDRRPAGSASAAETPCAGEPAWAGGSPCAGEPAWAGGSPCAGGDPSAGGTACAGMRPSPRLAIAAQAMAMSCTEQLSRRDCTPVWLCYTTVVANDPLNDTELEPLLTQLLRLVSPAAASGPGLADHPRAAGKAKSTAAGAGGGE